MAVGSAVFSSVLKQNNPCDSFNQDKINEFISSKSVDYDGKRVKWCERYELLQDFVKIAFVQLGKWKSNEGNSKWFDAHSSDYTVMWYPGKLNTLTFNGHLGHLAKECLIGLRMSTSAKDIADTNDTSSKRCDLDESVGDLKLQIKILKGRMDFNAVVT